MRSQLPSNSRMWKSALTLILLGTSAWLAGCGHRKSADPASTKQALPTVQVAAVARGALVRSLPATGTLQSLPGHEAILTPPVTGILDGLFAHYGEPVKKGQIIAHLSTQQITGQIQQAEAALGQSQIQVQQAEANFLQQKAQTRTAILQAEAAVKNAQATLAGDEATLTGAEASLRNAQQTLDRQKALFADGLVPQKDVDSAQLAVRTAQSQRDAQKQAVAGQQQTVAGQRQAVAAAQAAALQDAVKRKDIQIARQQVHNAQGALNTVRSQLALYTIRSPLTGEVTQVGATVGETVDTSTKIATVADLHTLQLQINVPGDSAPQIHVGQAVTFTIDSFPGTTFHAVLNRVASQVDPASGTVAAFAVVSHPGLHLKDDTTVQTEIVTERRTGVLTVPQSAILSSPDGGKPSVVIVGQDNIAHIVPIAEGLTAGGKVEIAGGLHEGQRVAISGQYGLPDGAKVAVRDGH